MKPGSLSAEVGLEVRAGMRGTGSHTPADVVPSHIAFTWPALADDSLVVSSGEGIAEKGYCTPLSSSSVLASIGPKSVRVDSGS